MALATTRSAIAVGAMMLAVAVGACRKEEQGRQLSFEPGVYKGQVPEKLPSATVRQLQERGSQQK